MKSVADHMEIVSAAREQDAENHTAICTGIYGDLMHVACDSRRASKKYFAHIFFTFKKNMPSAKHF